MLLVCNLNQHRCICANEAQFNSDFTKHLSQRICHVKLKYNVLVCFVSERSLAPRTKIIPLLRSRDMKTGALLRLVWSSFPFHYVVKTISTQGTRLYYDRTSSVRNKKSLCNSMKADSTICVGPEVDRICGMLLYTLPMVYLNTPFVSWQVLIEESTHFSHGHRFFSFFFLCVRLLSVLRGHSVFFIPATTANDLRLRRIFYPRFYPLHLFSYLNS